MVAVVVIVLKVEVVEMVQSQDHLMVDIEGEILSRSLRLRESARCPAAEKTPASVSQLPVSSRHTGFLLRHTYFHKKCNYFTKSLMA